MGRPSSFTTEIADLICQRIAEGETLRAICEDPDFPSRSMVHRWLETDLEFQGRYALAMLLRADAWGDEILDIADNEPDAAKARVRVDARKWLMAKAAPRKYGDRQAIELDVQQRYAGMSDAELESEMRSLLAKPTTVTPPGEDQERQLVPVSTMGQP
jgi:hypothetical protein